MRIFYEAEEDALERTKNGIPTRRQKEESDMKDLRDRHLKSYQLQTKYIAAIQDHLDSTREWKKNYPNDREQQIQKNGL